MALFRHALINSGKKKFLKTIRVNIYSRLFRQDERQTYTVFNKVPKDQTSLSVNMGKIKHIHIAVRCTKSLMTDSGLICITKNCAKIQILLQFRKSFLVHSSGHSRLHYLHYTTTAPTNTLATPPLYLQTIHIPFIPNRSLEMATSNCQTIMLHNHPFSFQSVNRSLC